LIFFRHVIGEGPAAIDPIDPWWARHVGGKAGQYYLRYFGEESPREWRIDLPKEGLSGGERFRVDVLDTWDMTSTPAGEVTLAQVGQFSYGDATRAIALPGRPWIAARLVRI